MIEKGKISAAQLSFLSYANIVVTSILIVPGITYKYAKQDLWLSPIWGALLGLMLVPLFIQLHRRYPSFTFVEYLEAILGRVLGRLVGLCYVLFFLLSSGLTLRQYGDFLVGAVFRETPLLVIMALLSLATTMVVHAGLEALARMADIFVPLLVLLWLLVIVLLLPDYELKQVLPIMENGSAPSLRGAVAPFTWNALFFYLSLLLPFVNERERKDSLKWCYITVIAVMITLVTTNLSALLLFGTITGQFVYPFMNAARYISYADFFENMEALVMAIWVGGMFIKHGFYQYVLVLSTAQWLHLSDYKSIAYPIGVIITILGLWISPSVADMAHFIDVTLPFMSLCFFILIPVMLLLIAVLKRKLAVK